MLWDLNSVGNKDGVKDEGYFQRSNKSKIYVILSLAIYTIFTTYFFRASLIARYYIQHFKKNFHVFSLFKKSSFFRKRYGIKKVNQNLLGIKLNYLYVIILNQALMFDQIKQSIIETYYDTLTLETAFHYFWLGFVIDNLGELVILIYTYSYPIHINASIYELLDRNKIAVQCRHIPFCFKEAHRIPGILVKPFPRQTKTN